MNARRQRRSRWAIAMVVIGMLISLAPPAAWAYLILTSESTETGSRPGASRGESGERERGGGSAGGGAERTRSNDGDDYASLLGADVLVRLRERLDRAFNRLDAGGALAGEPDPGLSEEAGSLRFRFGAWLDIYGGPVPELDEFARAAKQTSARIASLARAPSEYAVDRLNESIGRLNRASRKAAAAMRRLGL